MFKLDISGNYAVTSSRRLKIFHIISRLNVGGAAIYGIFLASYLKKRGHEVTLINGKSGVSEGDMTELVDKDLVNFEQIYISDLGREIHPLKDIKTLFKLIKIFWNEKPDVVHTHASKAGFLGRIAALFVKTPLIIHSFHGTIFDGYFNRWKSSFFIFIEKLLGKYSDCLFTDTASNREEIIRLKIAAPRKIKVVPIGIDLDPFKDITSFKGILRNKLHLNEKTKIIGTVARLVPIKGISYFLDAASQILLKYQNVHFVIVGDGELRSSLEKKVEELGITKNITFLGFWRDLREIYADLDLVILSSLNEGSPITILEAMASGKPVIASSVGGVPDLIRHNENGLLVPSKNGDKIAEFALNLLTNAAECERLSSKAKQEVFEKFTILKSVENTEGWYLNLMNSSAELL